MQVSCGQRFVSFTHVERAKGVLGTHGDVPAGLRVWYQRSMTHWFQNL